MVADFELAKSGPKCPHWARIGDGLSLVCLERGQYSTGLMGI